jgi:predicted amidohydrolase YtcJ
MIARLYENIQADHDLANPSSEAPAFDGEESRIETSVFASEHCGEIWVSRYGARVVREVRTILRDLCLRQIAAVNLFLPLEDPTTWFVTAELENLGFFFAGILPETYLGDVLILQYLNNVDLDYGKIQIYAPIAQDILAYIQTGTPTGICKTMKQNRSATGLYADRVFRDAPVYTADRRKPWAEAVAVRAGKIVYVGDGPGLRPFIGPDTETVSLPCGLILPAFRDSHIHPLTGSLAFLECRLAGPANREAYLSQIARYARSNEDQPFLRGGGWLPDAFPDRGPNRWDLDAVVSDRPALLKSMDGHSAWVNTAALALAGIERNTPDPPGGLIERDPVTGEATGTLREWAAMELVENHLPEPTARDRITAGWAFLEQAGRLGIVSVHEAMAKEEELQTYQTLDREGDLTLRVQAALLCEPGKRPGADRGTAGSQAHLQGGRLAPRAAKLFVDGVVEGHTAWLLAPYEDRPGFYGERLWEPGDLNRTAAALDRAGFQLHFHAVGDGAVRNALDAVAYTAALNGPRDRRPMIAHGDLISSEDLFPVFVPWVSSPTSSPFVL